MFARSRTPSPVPPPVLLLLLIFLSVVAAADAASARQPPNPQGAASQNASHAASSQPVPNSGTGGAFVFRTSASEVVLYATVIDKHHRQVNRLTQQDFTVYEDNVPQSISSFRQEDVPVSLAIVVDNSASMGTKRQAVDHAALELVRASNPQDEAFVVNFSDVAFLDQDFTSNIDLLNKGLSHISSQGGTALYDALIAAADHLSKQAKHAKQVVLVITDGEDNSSSATLAETVRRIQNLHGPIVYSIGLLYDAPHRRGKQARNALKTLSNETGGIAFFPKSLNQVDAIATEVARDIREQYVIGYSPTRPIRQGGYRAIRVTAKAKGLGKLSVRTRAGYFAQSGSSPHP